MSELRKILSLPNPLPKPREYLDKRIKMINESISVPAGPTVDNKNEVCFYTYKDFGIYISKPGKETVPNKKQVIINEFDAPPVVRKQGRKMDFNPSFQWILEQIYTPALNKEKKGLNKENEESMEIISALLIRSAYLLDHIEEESKLRYRPPTEAVNLINRNLIIIEGEILPPAVFLYYIELIALNEDVKYYKRKEIQEGPKEANKWICSGVGRFNNLLSLVHAIAVFTEKVPPMEMVYEVFRNTTSKIHRNKYPKFKYTSE